MDINDKPRDVFDLDLMARTHPSGIESYGIDGENTGILHEDGVHTGDIAGVYTCVEPDCKTGEVRIIEVTHIYDRVNDAKTGGSIKIERRVIETFASFADFAFSPYFDKTLHAWRQGCPDASWGDAIQVNGMDVAVEGLRGFDPSIDIDYAALPNSTDWLGNTVYADKPKEMSIRLRPLSDRIELWRECENIIDTSFDEIKRALALVDKLERAGVRINGDSIELPLHLDEQESHGTHHH